MNAILLSTENADRAGKLILKQKLYSKSNGGEGFSSGILIKLSALEIEVTKWKTRLKHSKDNITS